MTDIFDDFRQSFEKTRQSEMTIQEYLELCRTNRLAYATAAERMLAAIGDPTMTDTSMDSRLSRIFLNRTIKTYPAFSDFYGMEGTIEQIVGFFRHAAQGLEERKQVLYLLGPVGCVSGDTEVLTPSGWVRFDQLSDATKVLQFNRDSETASFTDFELIKLPAPTLTHWRGQQIDQILSDEHRVLYRHDSSGELCEITNAEMKVEHDRLKAGFRGYVPSTFCIDSPGIDLTGDEIRLIVAIQADAHVCEDRVDFSFSKERKIERLTNLLERVGLNYDRSRRMSGKTRIRFKWNRATKDFAQFYGANSNQLAIFVDEITHWDGDRERNRYNTTNFDNAKFIQFAYAAVGRSAAIRMTEKVGKVVSDGYVATKDLYTVTLMQEGKEPSFREAEYEEVKTVDGFKYCVRVPDTYFLARRGAHLFLTGNSAKSSLAERLKELMEANPIYVLKCGDEVSPVFESPLGLFDPQKYGERLEQQYGIPRRYVTGRMSPWAVKRLNEDLDGDISRFKVVKVYPSRLNQIAVSKVEPGDENNQDISSLVGKVDIRRLAEFSQDDPDCYRYSGGLCRANQGLLEFVEMFKAPIKVLHPLLTATQEGNYNGTEAISGIPFNGVILAHCFSEDTELLTAEGWCGIDDIEVGDEVATFNRVSGQVEYQAAMKKFEQHYVGRMRHIVGADADHLVTPNHQMIYRKDGAYAKCLAEDFHITGATIPVAGRIKRADLTTYYKSDDELRLHVWLTLLDASETRNGVDVELGDADANHLKEILNRLSYGFNYDEDRGCITISTVPEHLKEEVFTAFTDELSARQIDLVLEEWARARGYHDHDDANRIMLVATDPDDVNAVQKMAVEAGHQSVSEFMSHRDQYLVWVYKNTATITTNDLTNAVVHYSGRVWCLETPNHTLIARRNGRVMVTGNSNESEWASFKSNRNNEAFLDRVYIVKVPYCLRTTDEIKIYEKLLRDSSLTAAPCTPKTLEMLAQMAVLSRLKEPENSSVFSKMRVYDGENLKDSDPGAKSIQEYREAGGVDEGMHGLSTRWGFKVLSKVFNYDPVETGANPVHLLRVLEDSIVQEQFDREREDALTAYIKWLREKYAEFIAKEIKIAYLESYREYGQNLFDRYIQYADHWIDDKDYRDPDTGEMYDREALNRQLEQIEKPSGISNPSEFRNEIVKFALRHQARAGQNPRWDSYEKLREVIEAKMFAATDDILPVISFDKKPSAENDTKHKEFVTRMKDRGYSERQVRIVVDWYMRAKNHG